VYVRIYSGELRPKDTVVNSTNGKGERVTRIYQMMGENRDALTVAGPGEIVAVVGLRHTRTGNALCDPQAPIVLEEIRFPEPVVSKALLPDRTTDTSKLAESLARLVRDDPTLRFRTDPETGQLLLSGMGELHLEVSVEKLQSTPGIKVSLGQPLVAYRQTLKKTIEVETRYIKQGGGSGKYAVITCIFEPLSKEQIEAINAHAEQEGETPDPDNLYFSRKIVGGVVPREYIPAVEEGFRNMCRKGAIYGFPCVDIQCTLIDGKFHEKDSSPEAFRLAAEECTRDAQARAGIILLEPIMSLVVIAPERYQGSLIGDLNRRRGEILNFLSDKGQCEIRALAPLAEVFGYTDELRSATSGTGSFTLEPAHYAPVREELTQLRRQNGA
jgi:elongation factor G